MMNFLLNRKMAIILVLSLAAFIRFYHQNHLLVSDEANNMLTIKALIEGDGIIVYFYKHPPLFILLSSLLSYPFGDNHALVESISILFSVFALLPLFLIFEKMLDRKTALLAILILIILPVNIVYSTWAKQEAMLLFFCAMSLYFYISKKTLLAGLFFGLASLVKEFSLFFIPIFIFWELLYRDSLSGSKKRLKILLPTAAVVSFWWYIFYGGHSFFAIDAAVFGGNLFEHVWHYPWYYYLYNLRYDLTPLFIPFFLIALCALKDKGSKFFLLWVLAFYLPLSLFKVKAPWYTYMASPALSVLAAKGLLVVFESIKLKYLKQLLATIILLLCTVNVFSLSSNAYFCSVIGAEMKAFDESEYLIRGREVLTHASKVAILEYNPTLEYYLGITQKKRIYLGLPFLTADRKKVKALAEQYKVQFFVIDGKSPNYLERNIRDLTLLWGEPEVVGDVLIFDSTKELNSD